MLQTTVEIHTPPIRYPIQVGYHILNQLPDLLTRVSFPNHVLILTSEPLQPTLAPILEKAVLDSGRRVQVLAVPDGEAAKSMRTFTDVVARCMSAEAPGSTGLLALGGGAVGDLAGFVAGTLRRGVPYGMVPTTLLSQVDSSIGGKVAINLPEGKNQIGLFHHPRFVLSDVALLRSLPPRQIASGLAEVVKYALIADREFLEYIEAHSAALLALDPDSVTETVLRCAKIKANFVGLDPYDDVQGKGLRAMLNFGHTIGHAIESAAGYETYTHGEAISIGMACASALSERKSFISAGDTRRIQAILSALSLPTRLSNTPPPSVDSLLGHMKFDKKFSGGISRFVLLERIGKARLVENLPSEWIRDALIERGAAA